MLSETLIKEKVKIFLFFSETEGMTSSDSFVDANLLNPYQKTMQRKLSYYTRTGAGKHCLCFLTVL